MKTIDKSEAADRLIKIKAIAMLKEQTHLAGDTYKDTYEGLKREVIEDIVEGGGHYIYDVFYGGCESGVVSGLIYYSDIHAFADKYWSEIEGMRWEYEQSTGTNILCRDEISDVKNLLAWFAYEETLRQVADLLNYDDLAEL